MSRTISKTHELSLKMDEIVRRMNRGELNAEDVVRQLFPIMPPGDACFPALVVGTFHGGFDSTGSEHGFSSAHAGGANFLLGDGSVHFIQKGVDAETVRAMATRSGHEVLNLEL